MVYNSRFNGHEIYYDEPESAFGFNVNKLWGKEVDERVRLDRLSGSVEDFHDNVMELITPVDKKKGTVVTPFVYGLDSLDMICTEDEIDRDIRKGSFGGQKPKLIGEILRKFVQDIKNTDSALIIVSQTRDNIGVSFGSKKTRSGGKALHFASTHELWLAVREHIKRKDRDVGVCVKVKVSKNKLTGKLRTIEFPIYYDYGIDDITSCIDFLIDEKVWSEKNGILMANGEFGNEKTKRDSLIPIIEDGGKEALVDLVTNLWYEIEDSIATKDRKPKYASH
jgi:hypothetical protein